MSIMSPKNNLKVPKEDLENKYKNPFIFPSLFFIGIGLLLLTFDNFLLTLRCIGINNNIIDE